MQLSYLLPIFFEFEFLEEGRDSAILVKIVHEVEKVISRDVHNRDPLAADTNSNGHTRACRAEVCVHGLTGVAVAGGCAREDMLSLACNRIHVGG